MASRVWTFDADGKVSRFCHKLDTHQHWLACGGDHARQVLTEPAH